MHTFVSGSTKLGEIPMHRWNVPWDAEDMARRNAEAAVSGGAVGNAIGGGNGSGGESGVGGLQRKRKKDGLFRKFKRGSSRGRGAVASAD